MGILSFEEEKNQSEASLLRLRVDRHPKII